MYSLPESEYVERVERLRKWMIEKKFDAVYMCGPTNLKYFVGFNYLPTERPAAIVVPQNGEITFFGPIIEKDHIPYQTRQISRVYTYLDYPGEVHPMKHFARWLAEIGLEGKRIGVDNPLFYSSPYGYTGPLLSELVKNTVFVPVGGELYSMRLVKSKNELELVRESVRWGHLAHELLQKFLAPGAYDFEVAAKASLEATLRMKRVLGPEFRATTPSPLTAHAGIRGQVGPNSVFPHAVSIERPIQKGDIIGTGASADIDGYHSELERNLFMGRPDERVRKYHEIALKMQEAAFNALKPGVPSSEADKASYRVAKEFGVTEFLRHHSGHGMGLEAHEPPFLDVGDGTILRSGMVLSCEPGIYIPQLGGFRHSDTIIITEDGAEWVNKYPRDTESLIVEC
ncbi:MAG: Xaa-Pro peptidase family protein [Thermoprotei archaeon]